MTNLLVIFDLDGTLVDSETLCNQALRDVIPAIPDAVEALVDRYRGMKLADTLRDIEIRLGMALPGNIVQLYRQRVTELFDTDLNPVEGVTEMLATLPYPFCIASSGPPEKIAHALSVTGLAPYFGDRIFSAYVVGSWKPEPGLFLHAAAAMGSSPEHCVVVEDSPVGLEAAASAGMQALHYAPHEIASTVGDRFSSMSALPALLQGIAVANAVTGRDTP